MRRLTKMRGRLALASRIVLSAALTSSVTGCARENPEFGLGAGPDATGSSSGAEEPDGGDTNKSDTSVASDGVATGAMSTSSVDATGAADTQGIPSDTDAMSDGASETDDGRRCGLPLCDIPGDGCGPQAKCTLIDEELDGSFDRVGCVETVEDPGLPGDFCLIEPCGVDDCAPLSACIQGEQGIGVCHTLCHESLMPCAGAGLVCVGILGEVGVCRAECDILLQDCPEGQACFFDPDVGAAYCAPDNPKNDAGPCTAFNDCAIQHQCVSSDVIGECPDGVLMCCAPVCQVGSTDCIPDTCHDLGAPGQPMVGVCGP